ncbi:uncharacterized protein LY79DRAFT_231370 [Colletotrichum navitas]|uniref:Uncharacterized protein n=1 Tax=Colletotrichum navitas TaxID=681940 RepID=A0AAD8PXI1_9PEZI|nr:uncharacterized protein LY79DRAFT_231370 [Colletotrichum navitas]KAK1589895.1 hypothetical protein LY79DRAFT_231370 [Colletotrichum navitas]
MGGMFCTQPYHRVRSLPSQLGNPSSVIRHPSLITFFLARGPCQRLSVQQVPMRVRAARGSFGDAEGGGGACVGSRASKCPGQGRTRRRFLRGLHWSSPVPCRRYFPLMCILIIVIIIIIIIIKNQERVLRSSLSARQKNGGQADDEHPCPRPPTRGGGPGGGGVVGWRDHDGPVPAAVDRGLLRHAGVVGRLVVPHLGEVRLRARGDAGGGREEGGVVPGAGVRGRLDGGGCGCDGDGGDGERRGGGGGSRRDGGVLGRPAVEPGRVQTERPAGGGVGAGDGGVCGGGRGVRREATLAGQGRVDWGRGRGRAGARGGGLRRDRCGGREERFGWRPQERRAGRV